MSVLTGPAADLNEREPWRVAWPDVGRDETSPWRQPPGGRKPAGPRRRAEGLRFGAAFAGGLLLAACLILAFAVWLSGARNESLQAKGFDRWKVGSLLINDGTISATENWPASTPVALLRIPRYDRSGSVFGGVAKSQLRRGPGYDPTTARPGTVGNTVLIGKSATYGSPFAGLASLEAGDQLILTTAGGTLAYQVTEVRVTDKNDSFAYEATNSERLTLVGHHGNPLVEQIGA